MTPVEFSSEFRPGNVAVGSLLRNPDLALDRLLDMNHLLGNDKGAGRQWLAQNYTPWLRGEWENIDETLGWLPFYKGKRGMHVGNGARVLEYEDHEGDLTYVYLHHAVGHHLLTVGFEANAQTRELRRGAVDVSEIFRIKSNGFCDARKIAELEVDILKGKINFYRREEPVPRESAINKLSIFLNDNFQ